jgi:succinate dehydrogenase, hydrophobic membrane anchor protein
MSLRTPLARARGLGSAKEGVSHWWWQRLTAVALVPLSLWFVIELIAYTHADHATVSDWIRAPLTTTLLILFIVTTLYHTQLGMQVVFEDYIHTEWVKLTCFVLLKFAAVFLAVAGILSVLRIALGG